MQISIFLFSLKLEQLKLENKLKKVGALAKMLVTKEKQSYVFQNKIMPFVYCNISARSGKKEEE